MMTEAKREENWEARVRRRNWFCFYWTLGWVVTMAVATFGPEFWWESTALTVAAIAVNLGIGIGMLFTLVGWLKSLDEMQRRVQLEALAVASGVGVVGGLSYSLLDTTNLISGDAEIAGVVVLMSVTYLCGILIGNLRYR